MSRGDKEQLEPDNARRLLLKSSLGVVFSVAGLSWVSRLQAASTRPYLDAALKTEQWLRSARQKTQYGVTWPIDPLQPKIIDSTLYSGMPGVVLFYLELYHSTGEQHYLNEAIAGADDIVQSVLAQALSRDAAKTRLGFYDGLAGLVYVLESVHQSSRNPKYRRSAQQAIDMLARYTQEGQQWPHENDVISGIAGSGLLLIWWSKQTQDPRALSLARLAGRTLIERATEAQGGLAWRGAEDARRYMPNFAHGTAGVAYFLAVLGEAVKEQSFVEAAVKGAQHLQAITSCNDQGCLIHHHEPGGEQLHYLGWCHGPAGTARLYEALARVADDGVWRNHAQRSARALLSSGIPSSRPPGFWNNISQCCGNAGVAQFTLDFYRVTGDKRYLRLAQQMTADLLRRATVDAQGMRWLQAENRTQPDKLMAQTGFMQGAAGAGTWLLHLDGWQQQRAPQVIFPDSPFIV